MKEKFKIYLKSKDFLIPFTILLILTLYFAYSYAKGMVSGWGFYQSYRAEISLKEYISLENQNVFTYFDIITDANGYNDYFLILILLLTIYSGMNFVCTKFKNGFFKMELLREDYKKNMHKEIFLSYLKGMFPPILVYFMHFILGFIFLPKTATLSNYLEILVYFLWIILFTIIIINVSYILLKKIHNIYGLMIISFISMFASYFIIYIITSLFTNNYDLSPFLISKSNKTINNILSFILYFLIYSIPMYLLYRKKNEVLKEYV